VSHFTQLQTYIVERDCLVAALRDLGYEVEVGAVQARGFQGNLTPVEVRIAIPGTSYDVGFRRNPSNNNRYEAIADWDMLKAVLPEQAFLDRLHQRYAYHVAQRRLKEQGFDLVEERQEEGGRIRMVLRRMV
jgi:hypothetical protein